MAMEICRSFASHLHESVVSGKFSDSSGSSRHAFKKLDQVTN